MPSHLSRPCHSCRVFLGRCLELHCYGRPSPSVHAPQLCRSLLANLLFSICHRIVRSAASVPGECAPLAAHCHAFFRTHLRPQ
ncbi:hypothetical protein BOTBODRAFT_294502 [Botryobasidium botryosum FD-172 SS1]|uniref:Uncharacterized protein n=1 Tax=Botryobasidium botryosum (strain FD-172 SS1) TaxID=930990 RepID=A0A067LU88_BOTB1|nr:hypothetical protein BOTBODRAFT_294502 [Botryobasidium botryosum FD-172 SS1]